MRNRPRYKILSLTLFVENKMTFEEWWQQVHLPSYAYSNITDEELDAAQSAARSAWEAAYDFGYDQGRINN